MTALLSLGISLVGSLVSGKIQKSKAKSQTVRDIIPLTNTAGFGVGAGAITGDPVDTLAAILGSVIATLLHQLVKRLKKAKEE